MFVLCILADYHFSFTIWFVWLRPMSDFWTSGYFDCFRTLDLIRIFCSNRPLLAQSLLKRGGWHYCIWEWRWEWVGVQVFPCFFVATTHWRLVTAPHITSIIPIHWAVMKFLPFFFFMCLLTSLGEKWQGQKFSLSVDTRNWRCVLFTACHNENPVTLWIFEGHFIKGLGFFMITLEGWSIGNSTWLLLVGKGLEENILCGAGMLG